MAAVSVQAMSKVYPGGTQALNEMTLDFPPVQLTSLPGPSRCGSTTLLKIIAGLLEPTSGRVLVNGKPVVGPGKERAFELYSSNFLMEHFWALLLVMFFLAFLMAEGLAMLERRVSYFAANRSH